MYLNPGLGIILFTSKSHNCLAAVLQQSCVNTLAACGLEDFFSVVLFCQFLVLVGNRFWFYILTYLEYNTVVALC